MLMRFCVLAIITNNRAFLSGRAFTTRFFAKKQKELKHTVQSLTQKYFSPLTKIKSLSSF